MNDGVSFGTKVFLNKENELRCLWRVLAFFALLLVCAALFTSLVATIGVLFPSVKGWFDGSSQGGLLALFVDRSIALTSTLIASALAARVLERRSFASTGFKLHAGWGKDFVFGSVLGAATLSLAVGIAHLAGAMSLTSQEHSAGRLVSNLLVSFVIFLTAAAFEEVLLRGFAFQALVHNTSPMIALISTSVVFGLLHLSNPNVTLFSTLNTILAGVWLGVAYLQTRSLWLATALHYAWNLTMAFLFGLPVSGLTDFKSIAWLDGQATEPVWLSGGNYGPEGGLAATIALVICTLAIWKSGLFSASPDMLAALEHGKRPIQPETAPRDVIT